MPRNRTPHIAAEKRKPAPIHVRNVLDGLSPRLRTLALSMAGGDPKRVKILRPGAFEILDPETAPADA